MLTRSLLIGAVLLLAFSQGAIWLRGNHEVLPEAHAEAEAVKEGFVPAKKETEKNENVYDFTLTGKDGARMNSGDWRGKVVLLYFGFTHCPGICPAGLATLTGTLEMLGEQAAQIQPVFISVDVVRDTPEQLSKYMENFHPGFIALTGTQAEINDVTSAYGVVIRQQETDMGMMYNHTADTIVLDKQGEVVGYFPSSTTSADMAKQLQEWLN